jgi:tol-pal system protein YbgF
VIRRLILGAVLLAFAAPARAANKDLERLQQQIANLEVALADLKRGSDDNAKELRRLNEALADENASLKKSIADQKIQWDSFQATLKELSDRVGAVGEKLQAMQAGTAAAYPTQIPSGNSGPGLPPPSPGGAPAPSTTQAPRELYSQAYADYARGNYDLAIQGFEEYLRQFPNTDFSDNAEYWIGECLFGKGKYQEATDQWKKLFTDYPTSEKIPDAHYKRGIAYEKLGRRSQALLEYRYVVEHYPNSEAGRRARDKLNPQ